MLSHVDKVAIKILTSEEFIGGEPDILDICNDLSGGETKIF